MKTHRDASQIDPTIAPIYGHYQSTAAALMDKLAAPIPVKL